MIPFPTEVKECLQKSIWLTSWRLIQLVDLLYERLILHAIMEIAVDCYRSLVELVGLVIEKTEVAYL